MLFFKMKSSPKKELKTLKIAGRGGASTVGIKMLGLNESEYLLMIMEFYKTANVLRSTKYQIFS